MLVPPGERSWAHLDTATGALASGPVCVWRRIVPQSCALSVSPEIVAAREDFFDHGWTRINTDEDRLSLIRVHPCSSVVGTYWLRLGRAAQYRRVALCQTLGNSGAWDRSDALPNTIR